MPISGACFASCAIRLCFVETSPDFDTSDVFPFGDSMTRHPPFLHWVPSGWFPSFNGTTRMLRLPAVPSGSLRSPYALRYPSDADSVRSPGLLRVACLEPRVLGSGSLSGSFGGKRQDLPGSWETLARSPCSSTPVGRAPLAGSEALDAAIRFD